MASKSMAGEMFLKALEEGDRDHVTAALEKIRTTRPDQYLKLIATLVAPD